MRQPVPQAKRSPKPAVKKEAKTAAKTAAPPKLTPKVESKAPWRDRSKTRRVRGQWFELAGMADQQGLMMAVAKRYLKRAVDRNMVRRLAREAWRLHMASNPRRVESGRQPGVPTPDRPGTGGESAGGGVLLRLLRRPEVFEALPRGQCRQALRADLERVVSDWTGG